MTIPHWAHWIAYAPVTCMAVILFMLWPLEAAVSAIREHRHRPAPLAFPSELVKAAYCEWRPASNLLDGPHA